MKFLLIPVKDLSTANERLSTILNQAKRTELAYTMLEDVFAAAKESKLADNVVIVTLDKKAIEMALANEFEVIQEEEQNGESSSVDGALQVTKLMGAKSVLVIPGDAPLIKGEDIDMVFEAEDEKNCVVMVPASDELGTNAILRKPPDIIPSCFGHDSFNLHKDESDKKGVPYIIVDNFNISIDIDEPDDIEKFAVYGSHTKTYKKLIKLGLIKEKIEQIG